MTTTKSTTKGTTKGTTLTRIAVVGPRDYCTRARCKLEHVADVADPHVRWHPRPDREIRRADWRRLPPNVGLALSGVQRQLRPGDTLDLQWPDGTRDAYLIEDVDVKAGSLLVRPAEA